MSNHRASTDAQFDAHLATLTETTLDAKIAAWTALQTDLDGEKTEVDGNRSQVSKHRKKVADMLEDLATLKSYASAVQGEVTQAELDAVIADVTALQAGSTVTPTVVEHLSDNDDIAILATDSIVLVKHDQKTGLVCTLPSDAANGKIIVIKNYHIGDASQGGNYIVTVRPAQGQTPAHKIDYKFDSLELKASTIASGLMSDENEAARLMYYNLDRTWISLQDAY